MPDDDGRASFEDELRVRGLSIESRVVNNLVALVVSAYPIPRGPFAGRTIALGIILPADYPSTAPNGIHTARSEEISSKVGNPQNSELGGEWVRWSRVVQNWTPGNRRAGLFLAQVDSWLELR
jgi:hypothetical protein